MAKTRLPMQGVGWRGLIPGWGTRSLRSQRNILKIKFCFLPSQKNYSTALSFSGLYICICVYIYISFIFGKLTLRSTAQLNAVGWFPFCVGPRSWKSLPVCGRSLETTVWISKFREVTFSNKMLTQVEGYKTRH